MVDEEYKEVLLKIVKRKNFTRYIKGKKCSIEYPGLYEYILTIDGNTLMEKIYNLLNDCSTPKCKMCDNPVKLKSLNGGYDNCCSGKCSYTNDVKILNKIKRESYLCDVGFIYDKIDIRLQKYGMYMDYITEKSIILKFVDDLDLYIGVLYYCKKFGVDLKNVNYKELIYCFKNKVSPSLCRTCGKKLKFRKNKYLEYCSVKCGSSSENVRMKVRKTLYNRYGYDVTFKSPKVRRKSQLTYFEKKVEEFKNSDKPVEPKFSLDKYLSCSEKMNWRCLKCGEDFLSHIDDGSVPECPICFPRSKSKYENEIYDFLKEIGISNIKINDRDLIYPKEIDFVIEDKKIGIEFNGIYWHSVNVGKDRYYHLNKTELVESKGYRLIQIFEDEWIKKKDIVKSNLKNILGLSTIINDYSYISEIGVNAADFLNRCHIDGNINADIHLGLINNDRIIQMISINSEKGYHMN